MSMQLFATRYLGPTDRLGSRFIVTDMLTGKTVRVPYDGSSSNAAVAAVAKVSGDAPDNIRFMGEDNARSFYLADTILQGDLR